MTTLPTRGDVIVATTASNRPRRRIFVLSRDADDFGVVGDTRRIRVFERDERVSRLVGELREVPIVVTNWRLARPEELDLAATIARAEELVERGDCDPVELGWLREQLAEAREVLNV